MRAEILYPEICNLCGDLMNVRYLQQSCPGMEVISTDLKSRPVFLDEPVDLVYLGSTTEKGLQLVVQTLLPYKDELIARLDEGQRMLVTGNALDALGLDVESDDGLKFDGLGILPTRARYQMMKRHNSFFLGKFGELDILGFKSLFGHTYDAPETDGLFTVVRGVGRHPGSKLEGFRRGNLMATYLTGPLLPMNPPFVRYLLGEMGCNHCAPAFEEAAMNAYRQRLSEFSDERRNPVD